MPGVAVATTSRTAASRLQVQLFVLRRCPKKLDLSPYDQRGFDWAETTIFLNSFDEFVPKLSLKFCASGCVHEQLAIMPILDSMRCIEESMKASRFARLCSAAVRQSLVGASVVVSLLSASQLDRRMVM